MYIALYSAGSPVSGKAICEYCGVSQRSFEHILQRLVQAKVLRGTRGPKGGYSLAIERRRLTLDAIFLACLEDVECENEDKCNSILTTVINPLWKTIEDDTIKRLEKMTLEDLCNQAKDPESTIKNFNISFNI